MDLYSQFMELFELLTPEQKADLLEAAKLMLSVQAPDADADGE